MELKRYFWKRVVAGFTAGLMLATGLFLGTISVSNSTGLVLVAEDGSTRTVTLHTHTLGDWQTVQQPVCVPGKEVRRCTSCGEEVEVRYQLPVHSYSAGGTVLTSPTLEQPGTMVKTCADCQTEVILPLSYGDVDLSGDVAVTDVMTLAQAVVNSNPLPEGIDGNFDQSTETPTKLGVLDVMALATYVVNH